MHHLFFALLHSIGLSHKKLALIPPEKVENFYQSVNIQKLLQLGIIEDVAMRILDKKNTLNVERVERLLSEKNIRIIHRDDAEYPQLLINIADAPTILYVRGKLPDHDALISVVGSRRHSSYAQSCLEKMLPDLIRSGYVIVSGGAYGIDSLAHEITLKNS